MYQPWASWAKGGHKTHLLGVLGNLHSHNNGNDDENDQDNEEADPTACLRFRITQGEDWLGSTDRFLRAARADLTALFVRTKLRGTGQCEKPGAAAAQ